MRATSSSGTCSAARCRQFGFPSLSIIFALMPSRKSPCSAARYVYLNSRAIASRIVDDLRCNRTSDTATATERGEFRRIDSRIFAQVSASDSFSARRFRQCRSTRKLHRRIRERHRNRPAARAVRIAQCIRVAACSQFAPEFRPLLRGARTCPRNRPR